MERPAATTWGHTDTRLYQVVAHATAWQRNPIYRKTLKGMQKSGDKPYEAQRDLQTTAGGVNS